jgi:hypothetical protein
MVVDNLLDGVLWGLKQPTSRPGSVAQGVSVGEDEVGAGEKDAGEGGWARGLSWEEEQELIRQMVTISQTSSTVAEGGELLTSPLGSFRDPSPRASAGSSAKRSDKHSQMSMSREVRWADEQRSPPAVPPGLMDEEELQRLREQKHMMEMMMEMRKPGQLAQVRSPSADALPIYPYHHLMKTRLGVGGEHAGAGPPPPVSDPDTGGGSISGAGVGPPPKAVLAAPHFDAIKAKTALLGFDPSPRTWSLLPSPPPPLLSSPTAGPPSGRDGGGELRNERAREDAKGQTDSLLGSALIIQQGLSSDDKADEGATKLILEGRDDKGPEDEVGVLKLRRHSPPTSTDQEGADVITDLEIRAVAQEQAAERDGRLEALQSVDGEGAVGMNGQTLSEMRAQVELSFALRLSEQLSKKLEQAEQEIDGLHAKLEQKEEDITGLKLALSETEKICVVAAQRARLCEETGREKERLERKLSLMDELQRKHAGWNDAASKAIDEIKMQLANTENALEKKEKELQAIQVERAKEQELERARIAEIDEIKVQLENIRNALEKKERELQAIQLERTKEQELERARSAATRESDLKELLAARQEAERERQARAEENVKAEEKEAKMLAQINELTNFHSLLAIQPERAKDQELQTRATAAASASIALLRQSDSLSQELLAARQEAERERRERAEENVKANTREAEVLALVTDLTSVNLLLEQEVGPCCSVQLYIEEGLRRKACSHVLVHTFNIQTHTRSGTNVPR